MVVIKGGHEIEGEGIMNFILIIFYYSFHKCRERPLDGYVTKMRDLCKAGVKCEVQVHPSRGILDG